MVGFTSVFPDIYKKAERRPIQALRSIHVST